MFVFSEFVTEQRGKQATRSLIGPIVDSLNRAVQIDLSIGFCVVDVGISSGGGGDSSGVIVPISPEYQLHGPSLICMIIVCVCVLQAYNQFVAT